MTLRRLIPRGDFFRGALTIVAGAGLAQVLIVATSPIITRLYSPAEFGVFAVLASVLALIITATALAYELAIPLPESDESAANVVALCLTAIFALTVAAAAILWVLGPTWLGLAATAPIGAFVVLLALGQIGGGLQLVLTSWAVRSKSYRLIGSNRLAQSSTLVVTQIGLGWVGLGAAGLLIGAVAGSLVASARLARAMWRSQSRSLRQVSVSGVRQAASRYRRFPMFSLPASLLNVAGLQAPLLSIVILFGTTVGGQFALAHRVVALPSSLVAGAMAQVYFAEAAAIVRVSPLDLRSLFVRTTRSLALLGILPFTLAAVISPLVFGTLFGQAWGDAGIYVAILVPNYYLQFVTSPTGATLDVLERQDLNLIREFVRIGLLASALLLAWALGSSPVQAVALLSVAGCLTYLLHGWLSWHAIRLDSGRRRSLLERRAP